MAAAVALVAIPVMVVLVLEAQIRVMELPDLVAQGEVAHGGHYRVAANASAVEAVEYVFTGRVAMVLEERTQQQ
jgi:hypothetical protein